MKLSNKLLIVLAVLLISALFVGNALAMSGSGTSSDPYIVTTAQDLQAISSSPSAYYELGNDISLSGVTWTTFAFSGHLDGKNYVISDLTHTNSLFTSFTGEMKDITFSDFEITSTSANSGIITNSVSGNSNIMSNIVVTDSSIVSTGGNVGGFAGTSNGIMSGVTVKDSYIKGSGNYVGGLLGNQDNNPTSTYVSNCNSFNNYIENTNSNGYAGGLIGRLYPLNNINYNLVSNCNVKSNYVYCAKSGGLLGYFVPCHAADRWGGTYFYVFDNCNIENNLIVGDSYSGGLYPYGDQGSRGFTSPYNPITSLRNSEMSNNIIYSNSGRASLISNRMALTKDSGWGTFESIDSVYKNNVVYTNSGNVFYVSGEIREIWNSGTVTISDSNFYGATVQPTPDYVVLENVTNTMDVYYTSNPVMDVEQLTDEGLVHIDIFKGIGTVLNVDTSNHVVNSGMTFNDGLTTFNDYPSVTYENTYAKGTYTATANFGFINPSDLSTTLKSTSKQFVVKSGDVEPTIENVTTSSSTIIQTGDVDVTLSATITPPPDYTIDSIQWQYSVDNVTFSNINGATTAVSTWRVPVGNYYVRVLVTVDGVATPSDAITQTAYGLPTIDFATLDGKSDSDVAFLRNTRVVCDGGYTPSSNPVPDTYSQWQSSSNGGTVWSTIALKDVDYTTWTAYTTGNIKIRYAVGDDDSGIFVSKVFNVTVVKPQSITVVADKNDAGIGETVTLTATITNPHPDASNKWQSSPDNDVYTDISGETGLVYDFVTSNVGTMYYRFVSTTQFGTYYSAVVSIRTYGAPTVSANVSPLSTSVDSEITLTGNVTVNPTMGDSDYSVQWKYSDDDGESWTNISGGNVLNTVTSFDSGGDYKIKLVVTDDYYTVDSTVFSVRVISVPTIESVSVSPNKIGVNGTISLNSTVTSETQTLNVQWKYKSSTANEWTNVTGGNVQNCTLSISNSGTYNIKLIATNEYGNAESSVFNVEVYGQPTVSVNINPSTVNVDENITLTSVVTPDVTMGDDSYTVQWKYSNNNGVTWNNIVNGDSKNITTSFSTYGEYKIKLVVTDDYFTVDSQILTCNVVVAPEISSFSISPSKVAVNEVINLNSTVTSETGNYSVQWAYKPSESSVWTNVTGGNVENTTLSLSTAGVYDVKLTATNEYGSVYEEDEVTVIAQPVISISLNKTDITLGDSVTLTESITDSETGVSDIYVSYDSGSTWEYVTEMSGLTQVLTPDESGIVKYKVTYDNDLYELDSNIVSLNVYDVPVVSSVQITPSSGRIAYGNSITASVEVQSELQTTNSWWYSQSGVKTTIPNSNVDEFEYADLAVGEYTIGVDVRDSLGNTVTQTCSSTIYVYGAPSISISTSSHNVAVNTPVTISQTVTVNQTLGDSDYTSNIMVSYNGGEYVNCTSPYTVTQTGVYYFKGVVSDNYFSHIESSIETVNVGTIPAVTGSVDSDKVSTGSTIYLTGNVQSELTVEDYGWKYSTDGTSYSDITTQSDYSASFLCSNAGTYYFKFFAENALGIGESNVLTVNAYDARTITVTAMPSIVSTSMSITLTANVTTPSHASSIVSKGWELNHNGVWESMGIQDEITSYIPQNYGDYLFRYKIVDEIGVTALSNTATVTVSNKPTVSIIVPENAIAGQSVLFTADVASLLEISSEKWYVDNIQVGTGESLVYTFNNLGDYVVKFTAENELGETSAYSIVHVYNVPVISDFTIQSQSLEYGGYQTVTVESNVDSQGLVLQQNYEGRGWTNIGIPFIHSYGNTYTLTYQVQTDAGYGGNVDVRVMATNPVGSVTSDVKSFTVEGKQPTEYSKAFTKADGMAQTAIIIAAIVMLVIIGIFVVTVCTGTLEPMMALKALGIIGVVFIVIISLIVFVGSLSGVTAPLL